MVMNIDEAKQSGIVKLNVGCGRDIRSDMINIDYQQGSGVDLVINFNEQRLTNFFEPRSVDYIFSSHFLEHIIDPVVFMNDCISVLKSGGRMLFELPNTNRSTVLHFRNRHGKQYMNDFNSHNQKSLQLQDSCKVISFPSRRNRGLKRFLLNNFWDLEAWLERRFWDQYTYSFEKHDDGLEV